MKYIIEAFDKETELLVFEVELPTGCDVQLAVIMGWLTPQRGDEGYNLNNKQAEDIEGLLGRKVFDQNHIFQLTCNAT